MTTYCANSESVIITLDTDDALLGPLALDRVRAEYTVGPDATVGSMVRLDKEAPYPVNSENPRSRGSNVWQHLGTFRKYLFDAIAVEGPMLDGEWAFMVPNIEMASNPRPISEPLHRYEPAAPKNAGIKQRRDLVIARILERLLSNRGPTIIL